MNAVGGVLCPRVGRLSVVVAALACVLAPASAFAAASRPSDGDLSPRLAELAKPAVRAAPPAEQAERLSVAPEGPGSLLRDGNRVLVDVRFERGAAAGVDDLRSAGAKIVHVSRRYQTVTVAVKPVDLPSLADVARVGGVTEVLAPIVSATECAGLVTSEGDAQLRADSARSGFNLDGSSVRVGILSDSFDTDTGAPTHAAEDVASGDLPGPGNPCGRTTGVTVFEDFVGGADEGRAMAQIVHDLAPGASLAYATAFKSEIGFAGNIRALARAGASVIVDDVIYLDEPFFQDGPIAVAVNEVTAAGVNYLSAAGNNNLIDAGGNDIASWEAPAFRDTSCPPSLEALLLEACMDFDPGAGEDPTFGITVSKGATLTVDLQWAEPWHGVTADLDAVLIDSVGAPLTAFPLEGGQDNVGDTQQPVEVLQWENDTGGPASVRLAINRCFGLTCNPDASPTSKPRLKFALLQNGGGVTATEYPQSSGGDTVGPTIFGHAGAAGAVGVGAVRFNNSMTPEPYSSRGPVTHYFGPVNGVTAAAPLAPPQERPKPDLVATDCGLTTFFVPTGIPGIHRFCGTSAAAPHAAAVVALMRQANPSLSVPQARVALAASARPVGAFGVEAVGAGLIDAVGAVSRVALPPQVSITERPKPLSRNRRPSIGFAANRPVSFACSIDGGAPFSCSSPFVPVAPLSDGTHGFAVSGTDISGRSGTSEVVSFRIDTRPPRVFFRKRPRKTIRTRKRRVKAVFRLGSNEPRVTFICRIDGRLPRFCKRRFVRRFGAGRHLVRVRARDAAGNVTRRPAVYRFRVKRRGS